MKPGQPGGEMYGPERLASIVKFHREHISMQIYHRLMEGVGRFVDSGPEFNDMTLVVARVLSDGASAGGFLGGMKLRGTNRRAMSGKVLKTQWYSGEAGCSIHPLQRRD
jgi:hypothetical protein